MPRVDGIRRRWCAATLLGCALAWIPPPHLAAQGAGPPPGTTARATAQAVPSLLLPRELLGPSSRSAPESWHVTLPGLTVDAGLGPVGFADLADQGDRSIPRSVRSLWLDRIEGRGRERGSTHLAAGFGVGRGPWALVAESEVFAEVDLSPGAAELLLFGNAGRTGEPRELDVAGSAFSAVATTSVGVTRAWQLSGAGTGEMLTLEGRVRWVVGNALYLGSGGEGGTAADPLGVEIEFPVVEALGDPPLPGAGGGVGIDLALAWADEERRWEAGAAIIDLVSTLRWRAQDLAFRPGTAFFDERNADTEFGKRPVAMADLAPAVERLVAQAERLRFQPLLQIGVALRPSIDWRYSAGIERTRRDGIRGRVGNAVQVGAEWRAARWLETRAVVRRQTGETRLTLGGGVRVRAVELSGVWGYRSGGGLEGEMVGLVFRWMPG